MTPSKFWSQVNNMAGSEECWPWLGGRDGVGYGSLHHQGATMTAHRYLYQIAIGPIPDGLTVDHVCHNRDASCPGGKTCRHRICCNPSHLEAVTRAENRRRAPISGAAKIHSAKTKCNRGHDLTPDNLMNSPDRRTCRKCAKIRRDAHLVRLKAR